MGPARHLDADGPKPSGLRRIAADLWETSPDQPFPGVTTHAYLWRSPAAGNLLFYSVASDRDLDELDRLGGVAHQYLSHRDEAGPMLAELGRRFGSRLHAPAAERAEVARHRQPDHQFGTEAVTDANGVEVVPTPGHSPGSTCFVVHGAEGRYLFTGDTLFRSPHGRWTAGYLPGTSDADALAASLDVLAGLDPAPDLVVSSAFAGQGHHAVDADTWARALEEARQRLYERARATRTT